jgi:hypothetical protein
VLISLVWNTFFKKIQTTSDVNVSDTKVEALNMIYNFAVYNFFIWDSFRDPIFRLKILKKLNFKIREYKMNTWTSKCPQIKNIINNRVIEHIESYKFGADHVNIWGHLKKIKILNLNTRELKTNILASNRSQIKSYPLQTCRSYWELQFWYRLC